MYDIIDITVQKWIVGGWWYQEQSSTDYGVERPRLGDEDGDGDDDGCIDFL